MLERLLTPDNVLDRLAAAERRLAELETGAVTVQVVQTPSGSSSALNGWLANGSAFQDLLGRIVLDASLPGIRLDVGGIIYSSDYQAGASGFKIDGGTAEFNNVVVRGTVYAAAGEIAGWTIASGHLYAGSGSTRAGLRPADYPFYAGSDTPSSAPFRVTPAGALTAANATITGTITASAGSIGGWSISSDRIAATNARLISGAANTARLEVGTGIDANTAGVNSPAAAGDIALWAGATHTNRASAPFRLTAAGALTAINATITGTVYASAGYISGSFYVGAADPRLVLDGANKRIQTSTFSSGTKGFRLDGATGSAEFADVVVRGALRASTFLYGQILATGGTLILARATGRLYADCTIASSFSVDIADPDGMSHDSAGALWTTNDIIRLKDPLTADVWAKVTAKTDMSTYWRLTVSLQSGSSGVTFCKGMAVVNYGQSGQGVLWLTADDGNAPFYSVRTHAGAPWDAMTELARLGNLVGNWGYSSTTYGIALGRYAANMANLTWDPTNGLRLRTYSTTVLQLDQSGNADITGKLRLPGTGSALAIGATPPTSSSAGTGIWIDRTGIYTLDSGVNQVWLSTSDGCLYAGTDIRLSNGMIRIRDASPAATIAWRNATDTDYIGYLLSVFGGVGIGFAFNDAAGYFFSDKDARIGGGLYVGGTGTNPAAGYVEVLYDVMPYGTKRGVWRRFVEVSGNVPTDHFTSGRITSGYAWAGSPFATPSIVYSYSSDYLGFYNSGPGRYFMYKSIPNNSTNWRGMYIEGRLCAGVNGSVGLRVDDGTDNNYAEIYADNTAADGANTIKFSQRTGGGAVTTATAGCKPPISQYMVLRLLCYWDGSSYFFYGYIVDENGAPVNVSGFNTAAVAWCPASGRAGIVGRSSAACGYLKCDWFYNCFS